MPKITACKDCEDRHPACHDTCERYLEQKRRDRERKNQIWEGKVKDAAYMDYARKRYKKYKREI